MNRLNKLLSTKKFPSVDEESKYQSLINSLNGFEEYLLDSEGTIISTNLESVSITGYEEWELIGKPFSVVYTEEEINNQKPELDLAHALNSKNGSIQLLGFKQRKKGGAFYAKTKIISIVEEGTCIGFKVVIQDTTHETIFSIGVRSLKEEYTQLFNNPYFGIFKFRLKDGKMLGLNSKAKELFNKVKDASLDNLFAIDNEKQSFYKKLHELNIVTDFQFKVIGTDDAYFSISCKFFKNLGIVEGVLQDITKQRRALEEVKSINNELDTFLYRASHDLRAPLTTILGLTELIKIEENKVEIKNYNEKIKERVSSLDALLKNLSLIAYNNAVPSVKKVFNLKETLSSILQKYSSRYPLTKCKLVIQSNLQLIHSDEERITILLNNLIENAFKFSVDCNLHPFVVIELKLINEHYQISVRDNGQGIAPENLTDIFKLFFKAAISNNGSGLGLYLVKSIIHKLEGEIDVNSEIGKGTEFIVTIPA